MILIYGENVTYCKKCDKSIEIDSKYCPNCGSELFPSAQSSGFQFKGSDKPILVLKPKFLGLVTALTLVPKALFFTLWGGIFFGVFGMFAVQMLHLNLPFWFTFVFFALLFLLGIPIIGYFAKKKTYEKTEYRFYSDKLEYYEGFFSVEEKSINYKNITEAQLRKGIIQRGYNMGTIILATPATGVFSGGWQSTSGRGMPFSGVRILDIENPDENYKKIKELMGKTSS